MNQAFIGNFVHPSLLRSTCRLFPYGIEMTPKKIATLGSGQSFLIEGELWNRLTGGEGK